MMLPKVTITITEIPSGYEQTYYVFNNLVWTPSNTCVEYADYYEIAHFSWYMRIDKKTMKVTGNLRDADDYEDMDQYTAEIHYEERRDIIPAYIRSKTVRHKGITHYYIFLGYPENHRQNIENNKMIDEWFYTRLQAERYLKKHGYGLIKRNINKNAGRLSGVPAPTAS